jgi:hypothetical protein
MLKLARSSFAEKRCPIQEDNLMVNTNNKILVFELEIC